ncbi:MAG: type II 3-dehydroquinate dehydratase [Desulfomonilia bacterium]
MKILIVNGPNMNMIGKREPSVYGEETLGDMHDKILQEAELQGIDVVLFQSNHEGEIIDRIHAASLDGIDCMIVNPAGYTHTSVAIRDAILCVGIPFIEVHLSNTAAREPFRHRNLFSDIAVGTIAGLGVMGYILALRALKELYGNPTE